jgi:exosome complex RNA-binding protein Csl4
MILIVEADNGVYWAECSNCREKLTSHDNDDGRHLECGQCGSEWLQGKIMKRETTKAKDG